jgi:long-chain acyl-CoA synthetase
MLHTELIAPLPELLARHAAARPDKVAYWDSMRSVTYLQLGRRTAAIAASLTKIGVREGDKVALFLPNGVDWVEACFACLRAGAVVVPISHDAAEGEISYRLADARCRLVFTSVARKNLVARLPGDESGSAIIATAGEGAERDDVTLEQLASGASGDPLDPSDVDRASFILYTSGTTGRAKGVLLSVRGMLWIAAACWAPICGLSERDVVLSPLPLFHSYALNLSVLSVLATGASEHIMVKFSPHELGIEALGNARLCISAGAIMPAALNRAFEERFGLPLLDGYGITETSTMVTMNWMSGVRPMGSCGLPVPGLAVRILDPLTLEDVPLGDEGELIVRGPNLMLGYHNKPAETEAALRKGWYHTGDLARSDANGFLTITGRIKELIIRGGQNIAPAEIEEVAVLHPQVVDCAVVGVRHATLGEVPHLFVVAERGELDVQSVLAHCRTGLSAYKIPEQIHIVMEIPRTGSGKIMRFRLVEALNAAND